MAPSEHLRRMAPAQSHEMRREFLEAANALDGIRLGRRSLYGVMTTPIYLDGDLIGYAVAKVSVDGVMPYPLVEACFVAAPRKVG